MSSFSYLILDLKRISQIDESAVRLLRQTDEMLGSKNKTLVLAHVPEHCSALFEAGQTSCALADIDSALEWCEDRLLQQAAPELLRDDRQVVLAAMDIMRDFTSSEIALVETILQEARTLRYDHPRRRSLIRSFSHAGGSASVSASRGRRQQARSTGWVGGVALLTVEAFGRHHRREPTLCYAYPSRS
jgi:hypothetical protein